MNQTQRTASALSGVLVKEEIEEFGLISESALEQNFKPTSYDLRLGREVWRPDNSIGAPESLPEGSTLKIPPFSSVVVSTFETVRMPNSVVGKFNLKIRKALSGLFVQMGTQVEPNYHGRLFALLQNVSGEPVELKSGKEGDNIFAIEFYYTSRPVTEIDPKFLDKKYDRISDFTNELNISGTLNTITSKTEADVKKLLDDRETLKKLQQDVEQAKQSVLDRRSIFWGAIFFTGMTLVVSFLTPFVSQLTANNYPSEKIEVLLTEVKDLNAKVTRLDSSTNNHAREQELRDQIRSLNERIRNLEGGSPSSTNEEGEQQ